MVKVEPVAVALANTAQCLLQVRRKYMVAGRKSEAEGLGRF